VGISTAINWYKLYQETGDVKPKPRGGTRKRVLEPYDAWIRSALEATPHLTVLKLQQALADQGVCVSHDTVWRTVRGLGLSFKKKPVRG
jgi:putative transposase